MTISLFIPGVPVPGGSKKAWLVHQAGCPAASRRNPGQCICHARIALADAAGARNKEWRHRIATSAVLAMRDRGIKMLTGPLKTEMIFLMVRPKGHYNARGIVRNSAPRYPAHKPDAIKLARAAEDALNKILWYDDSQIVETTIKKEYSRPGDSTGLIITVTDLSSKENSFTILGPDAYAPDTPDTEALPF